MNSVLKIDDVSIRIKNNFLFENVSFEVNKGDYILLSGTNGIGKSSLIKSILQLQPREMILNGRILDESGENLLEVDSMKLQMIRSKIAYIPQKDEYSEMGSVQVKDIVSESSEAFSGHTLSFSEVDEIIDQWLPRKKDGKRIFNAKSKPSKLSGGEQRLLTVFTTIATRHDSNLLLIDEPLNNLDYINARIISDMINKTIKVNPEIAVLMVSHCRIFPFINREIKLSESGADECIDTYTCHSCFGEPDELGFYNV